MKIELDTNYCCNREMERKAVCDVGSKKGIVIYNCNHCKNSFKIDDEYIVKTELNNKKRPLNGVIMASDSCPFFARFSVKSYETV